MFKSNKFICFFLLILSILIILNPKVCLRATLLAISVWATKLLPVMFPSMILAKLIINLSPQKTSKLDKLFNKIYKTQSQSFLIFVLSIISGSPNGAKLASEKLKNNEIDNNQFKTMFACCSILSPTFMISIIGTSLLSSTTAGIIIFISNVLSCLIVGFVISRTSAKNFRNQVLCNSVYNCQQSKINFSIVVEQTTSAMLNICSYLIFCNLIISFADNYNVFNYLSICLSSVFHYKCTQDMSKIFMNGLIEITQGITKLATSNISLKYKTIVSSSLCSFGGLSIILQNYNFAKTSNLKFGTILFQKFLQLIISFAISFFLTLIYF